MFINTTHAYDIFFNQVKIKVTRCGTNIKISENKHDFSYQCSKDNQDFLFVKLSIWDERYEPVSPK